MVLVDFIALQLVVRRVHLDQSCLRCCSLKVTLLIKFIEISIWLETLLLILLWLIKISRSYLLVVTRLKLYNGFGRTTLIYDIIPLKLPKANSKLGVLPDS